MEFPQGAIEVPYARTGLQLGLAALGVAPGSEVLLPAYHCAAMITPVVAGGHKPVFYDISPTARLDLALLERAITPGTRAVVAVHLFGFVEDLAPLRALCDARGLLLIEDATHVYPDRLLPQGDLWVMSPYKFGPGHEGGLLGLRRGSVPRLRAPTMKEKLRDLYALFEAAYMARGAGWCNPVLGLFVRLRYLGRKSPFHAPAPPEHPVATESELMALYTPPMRRTAPTSVYLAGRCNDALARQVNYLRLRHLEGVPELPPGVVPYALPVWSERVRDWLPRLHALHVKFQRFGLPAWPTMDPGRFPNAARLARTGLQLPIHGSVREADLDRMAAACR